MSYYLGDDYFEDPVGTLLANLGSTLIKGCPCIWLRKAPSLRYYEYTAVYGDDLCIAAES